MQKIIYSLKNNSIKNFSDIVYKKHFKINAKLGFNFDSTIKNMLINIYYKINSISLVVFDKFLVINSVKIFTENLLTFNKNVTKFKKNEVNIVVFFFYSSVVLIISLLLI